MKRAIIFIWAIMTINPLLANLSNPGDTNPDKKIPINKKENENLNGNPLSIVEPDIEANYYGGMLTIAFNADLGDAIINVANLTTGEMWMESINGMGITTIELLDSEGYFIITIETDNGDYTGSFII